MDILLGTEGAPETAENASPAHTVLQPKVMSAHDLEEQAKEAQVSEDIAKAKAHDPYEDKGIQQKLLEEYRDLEVKIASFGLDKTAMDHVWKDFNTKVEAGHAALGSIGVARCYPMKNRFPDVLPFDKNRVELPTTKDDYINASHVRDVSDHAPRFIATQAPTKATLSDFWTMIWQENVETVVCLLSEGDLTDAYWPKDRKEPLKVTSAKLEVTLQSQRSDDKAGTTERIFTVRNVETAVSRVVVHIQLNDYRLASIASLVREVLSYHRQQRVLSHPVCVHDLGGSGKCGLVLVLASAIAEINVGMQNPTLIPDLVELSAKVCSQRRGILKSREYLKQAFQVYFEKLVLCFD